MNPKALASSAVIALFDQALMSAANFLASAFLIHFVSKEMYGTYGVAYGTLLLLESTVDVLFSLQMTYLAPHIFDEVERKKFCSALLIAQTTISVALGIVIFLCGMALYISGKFSSAQSSFILIVGLGSLGLCWQEYYRSLAYMFGKAPVALCMGIVQTLVWAVVALVGFVLWREDLAAVVLAGWCIGSACAALMARFFMPLPPPNGLSHVIRASAEVFHQGIWSTFGSMIIWIQNQSYCWILAVFCGPESTAEVNFAKLFFSPLGLMLSAINRIARPSLASTFATAGEQRARIEGRKLLAGAVALVVVYAPAILLAKDWIITMAGAKAYAGVGGLILAWAFATTIQVTRWNSTLLLGVFRRNRQMTTMQVFAAAATVLCTIAFIHVYAAIGSILSIGAGEMILSILLWREVNRAISSPTCYPKIGG